MLAERSRPFHALDKVQSQEDTCSISSGYVSDSAESWSCASNADGFYSSQTSSTSSPSSVSGIGGSLLLSNSSQSGFRNDTERLASWLDGQESDSERSVHAAPAPQRQHPRRTCPTSGVTGRTLPCSLTRQDERSEGFVALLVAFTAGLVECIWPLSACPPRVDPKFYGGGVLPLKTFIQETLRRSKTSYSTLQVALYYLIVLKDHLPKGDFTQEQSKENDCRAMQCGRRMFLSALILASKYLQDRNYSTRAWSKISGLRTIEINQNEIKYLQAIDWKLHLSKETFDRWSRIVLRLSAAPAKDNALFSNNINIAQIIGWKILIQRITPDLPEDFAEYEMGLLTPPVSLPADAYDPSDRDAVLSSRSSRQKTPPSCIPAQAEPTPRPNNAPLPTLPPMPRLHNLPTPQTTPCSGFSATPCVALKSYPRCSASYAAMSNVRRECLARATLDRCPPPQPQLGEQTYVCQPQYTRRSSLSSSVASLASSPESMVSDHSSISTRSRSSSISSVTSASCGIMKSLRLDRLASRRCLGANATRSIRQMPSMDGLLNSVSRTSIPPIDEAPSEVFPSPGFYGANPESFYLNGSFCSAAASESDFKPIPVQSLPSHDNSLMELEAAAALCNLRPNLTRSSTAIPPRATPMATPKASQRGPVNIGPSKSHKRSHSKVNDALQDEVRKSLLPGSEDVNMVIADDDYPLQAVDANVSPMFKASQSPSRSWAPLRTPVPVRGTENSKRWCATENYNPAVNYAARLLRPDLQQSWG